MYISSKLSISSFHKRIVNLSILKIVYFLKKECKIVFLKVLNLKKNLKLINVLKSPVQFKVGRNQFGLFRYKSILFYNSTKSKKMLKSNLVKQFTTYLCGKINKNLISSNFFFKNELVLRNRI